MALKVKAREKKLKFSKESEGEWRNTAVIISCYDRDGKEVKRVTSDDEAEIDDGTGTNTGGSTGGNTGGSTGGDNGGNTGGGDNGGNGGGSNGNGESGDAE